MTTVEEILKSERQWQRQHRIAHIRYMMKNGPKEERTLWREALAAHFDNKPIERINSGHTRNSQRGRGAGSPGYKPAASA